MGRKPDLNEEMIERLKAFRGDGLGLAEISERTGLSLSAICKHTKRRRVNPLTGAAEFRCSNCFEFKSPTEFYGRGFDSSGRRLYQARCKGCNSEVVAAYAKGLRNDNSSLDAALCTRASLNRVAGNPERLEAIYAEA